MRVMVVDNDVEFGEDLAERLRERGVQSVVRVESGEEALERFATADVILLDLGLPDIDGFEVCQLIRTSSAVPIIILSGRSDEFDRVLGLKVGADDYVVKPYSLRELHARIEAVFRRYRGLRLVRQPDEREDTGAAQEVRRFGAVTLDLRRRRVIVDGTEVVLTRKEFELFTLLSSEPGRTFTREQIMTEVWGYDGAGDTRTLGVHMAGLRKRLAVDGLIETVRGVGFRLVA